ncbi:hypothetical protein EGT74_14670 [Chitinophaga lutea]|uniref:Uncharacterized protein n=1 Tax=Chitinophaga lutea TaxID=2488634 RepID=A0A3N4PTG2_9BACT|nr:hypothetical protein [Chitinophaga lutea]RPE08301.1 hypothetical protein EGT74_14670 [Chitinophaga lutea]
MAILDPNAPPFIGTIGNLTYYRLPGSDKIIVRRKGGVSRKRIKNAEEYRRTRENNSEFSGCARAASHIRDVMHTTNLVADYNFTPKLIALMKKVQLKCDTGNRGERNIRITRYSALLEGFALNRYNPFTGIVRQPIHATIDRERATATIEVPALISGLNLYSPWKSPYYQLSFSFGAVQDLMFDGMNFKSCQSPANYETVETAWALVSQPAGKQTVTLQLPVPVKADETLILSAGIHMGTPGHEGNIAWVKRQGAGMILRVG